jgi:thioredoxin reductase
MEVDGVQQFPSNGIRVIIVGASVGGLGAALECWRKGCEVLVLERADKLSPLGKQKTCHYDIEVKDNHC